MPIINIVAIFGALLTIPTLLYFDKRKEKKKYRLVKNFDTSELSEVIVPPTIRKKYDEVNIANIQMLYRRQIENFFKALKKFVPEEFLQNLYNNVNEIVLRPSILLYFMHTAGGYLPEINKIKFRAADFFRVINHELLHMASTTHFSESGKEGKPNYLSGFAQFTDKGEIGRGLNEGYTVCLDHKFFNHNKTVPFVYKLSTYKILEIIAKLLESVVGEQDMMKFYFTADLNGLYNLLCNYVPGDIIYQFVVDCDFIYNFYRKSSIFDSKNIVNELDKRMNRIFRFLITLAYSKMCITNDSERDNKIRAILSMISSQMQYSKLKQPIMSDKDIEDAISMGTMFSERALCGQKI